MANRRHFRLCLRLMPWTTLYLQIALLSKVSGAMDDGKGPFLPVNPSNVWIYASYTSGYGPPHSDTTVVQLEGELIAGEQYWSMQWLSGPFRVGDDGNLWFRMNDSMKASVAQFKQTLVDNPELTNSRYYQQASFLYDLSPDHQDILLYDFSAPVIKDTSLTAGLDYAVLGEYIRAMESSVYIMAWKIGEPAPNQCMF